MSKKINSVIGTLITNADLLGHHLSNIYGLMFLVQEICLTQVE